MFGFFKKKPVVTVEAMPEVPFQPVPKKIDWARVGEPVAGEFAAEPPVVEGVVMEGADVSEKPVVAETLVGDETPEPVALEQAAPALPLNLASEALTAEDVVAAYKFFLGRFPENMDVIKPRLGLPPDRILLTFLLSDEFLSRPEVHPVILEAARKVGLQAEVVGADAADLG